MEQYITIHGARENNLKNISLKIPKNQLVVVTGMSGSGKSSLAFDILQKECQRQYMESMGMVNDLISKPDVDSMSGLSPAISVTQNSLNRSPRSTVGTVTDIFTYVRALFAKLGSRKCPKCGGNILPLSVQNAAVQKGIPENDSVICPGCQAVLEPMTMSSFSFNKQEGACPVCKGIGSVHEPDVPKVINMDLSIREGAIDGWDIVYIDRYGGSMEAAGKHYGFEFDTNIPVREYGEIQMDLLLYGTLSPQFSRHFPGIKPPKTVPAGCFEGIVTNLMRRYSEAAKDNKKRDKFEKIMITRTCPQCQGTKLKKESREVTLGGKSIVQLLEMPVYEIGNWLRELEESLDGLAFQIAEPMIRDMEVRITRLMHVGIGYLSLSRTVPTLSGGEAQRLRLASLLGSALTGVLYILDEPTSGLHPSETETLIGVLKQLRDLGNTVLVIEHDPWVMRAADYILDFGPGSGIHGGQLVASGTPEEVSRNPDSKTAEYIYGNKLYRIGQQKRERSGKSLNVLGANAFNLKQVDVEIPLNQFVAVTGVSGSGKSTFVFEVLDKAVSDCLQKKNEAADRFSSIEGTEYIDSIITVNQAPVGNSIRSNVATYTDIFTPIRNLYSELKETKAWKLLPKHFSFNVAGGRCEQCEGIGIINIPMHFLPDVQVTCPSCNGARFQKNILEIKYQGRSISDVLDMTIREAYEVFSDIPAVCEKLQILMDVGLSYLHLGQSMVHLSGGEVQRIKLARELGKKGRGHVLYLLDEPTNGLHPKDIEGLMVLLHRLVDQGNTVVAIEHNLQLISAADFVIDMGPEGGDLGGEIVAAGSPEELMKMEHSKTGMCLRAVCG